VRAQASYAIVIPTLNRHEFLIHVLSELSLQTYLPRVVIVVDASQSPYQPDSRELNVIVIHSEVQSAAVQRNIGLDYLKQNYSDIQFCAFLDDDVSFEFNYFSELLELITQSDEVIGVSGIAISTLESKIRRNKFLDFIGVTGEPGCLTKAAINVPVRNRNVTVEVDWLIGCSFWRLPLIKNHRFENDFTGPSIFEDVLFSAALKSQGKLVVKSSIILKHYLSQIGRPNRYNHYREWVHNRYRMKTVIPDKFSDTKFFLANTAFFMRLVSTLRIDGALGIIAGYLTLSRKR